MNISAAARRTDPTQRDLRSYHLSLPPWPVGTAALAFEIWVALAVSYYIAFMLELNSAASAGTGLLILVGPTQGMVLSKAIYRVLGTLFGAAFAIILTSLFSQDRTMLIAVFSVYMACLVAIGTLLRDFRAYGCILAGYTVALISIVNIDAPTIAFTAMLDRVAVILLAVLVLAFVSSIFANAESARSLQSKLRLATRDIVAMALAALRERFGTLSPREREIVIQVARGRLSKQIAGDIGIAEATVKVHRSRAMRKMNVRSLPELGRIADRLKLVSEKPQYA